MRLDGPVMAIWPGTYSAAIQEAAGRSVFLHLCSLHAFRAGKLCSQTLLIEKG